MNSFLREELFNSGRRVIVFRQFAAFHGGFDVVMLSDPRRLSEAEVESSNASRHGVCEYNFQDWADHARRLVDMDSAERLAELWAISPEYDG